MPCILAIFLYFRVLVRWVMKSQRLHSRKPKPVKKRVLNCFFDVVFNFFLGFCLLLDRSSINSGTKPISDNTPAVEEQGLGIIDVLSSLVGFLFEDFDDESSQSKTKSPDSPNAATNSTVAIAQVPFEGVIALHSSSTSEDEVEEIRRRRKIKIKSRSRAQITERQKQSYGESSTSDIINISPRSRDLDDKQERQMNSASTSKISISPKSTDRRSDRRDQQRNDDTKVQRSQNVESHPPQERPMEIIQSPIVGKTVKRGNQLSEQNKQPTEVISSPNVDQTNNRSSQSPKLDKSLAVHEKSRSPVLASPLGHSSVLSASPSSTESNSKNASEAGVPVGQPSLSSSRPLQSSLAQSSTATAAESKDTKHSKNPEQKLTHIPLLAVGFVVQHSVIQSPSPQINLVAQSDHKLFMVRQVGYADSGSKGPSGPNIFDFIGGNFFKTSKKQTGKTSSVILTRIETLFHCDIY